MFVCGISLGWLVGLSVSPVIQTVMSSLLGLVAGPAGLLVGLPTKQFSPTHPAESRLHGPLTATPLAMLLLGIAVASSWGIYCRTHNWLGVARMPSQEGDAQQKQEMAGLFAAPTPDECTRFRGAMARGDLKIELASSRNNHIVEFSKVTDDAKVLSAALQELICPASR